MLKLKLKFKIFSAFIKIRYGKLCTNASILGLDCYVAFIIELNNITLNAQDVLNKKIFYG